MQSVTVRCVRGRKGQSNAGGCADAVEAMSASEHLHCRSDSQNRCRCRKLGSPISVPVRPFGGNCLERESGMRRGRS